MTIEDGFTGTCPTCGQRDLRAEVERLRDSTTAVFFKTLQGCLAEAEAKAKRLRAVLADTHDNLRAVATVISRNGRVENADLDTAYAVLAALRARALRGAP